MNDFFGRILGMILAFICLPIIPLARALDEILNAPAPRNRAYVCACVYGIVYWLFIAAALFYALGAFRIVVE